jgi:membrane-bound serine protease (ClpP class)
VRLWKQWQLAKGVGTWLRALFLFVFMTTVLNASTVSGSIVVIAPLEGTVGISMESYMGRIMEESLQSQAEAVVFTLDTPGGLVSSMRAMTASLLDAPLPVVIWVSPKGARAASAGAFLLEAAHIAAMAPGTNVGAAHPVVASGKDVPDEEMKRKVTNDLAAHMRSLAQMRKRNSSIAEKMVTESLSFTAQEALKSNIIDVIASDEEELLRFIDGRAVVVQGRERLLSVSGATIVKIDMTPREKMLQFLSDPNVAYILLTAGIFAIVMEVLTPGGFVLGTSGAVMALMGAYGLRMLPFNWAGLILLLAGVIVIILDLLVGGIGILSLFGMAALVTGGLILFRTPGGELLNVSRSVIVGMTVAISFLFCVAVVYIWKSMRRQPYSGQEGLVGYRAEVLEALEPDGLVKCHGELWKARSESGERLLSGTPVRVVEVEGLVLVVAVEREESVLNEREGS